MWMNACMNECMHECTPSQAKPPGGFSGNSVAHEFPHKISLNVKIYCQNDGKPRDRMQHASHPNKITPTIVFTCIVRRLLTGTDPGRRASWCRHRTGSSRCRFRPSDRRPRRRGRRSRSVDRCWLADRNRETKRSRWAASSRWRNTSFPVDGQCGGFRGTRVRREIQLSALWRIPIRFLWQVECNIENCRDYLRHLTRKDVTESASLAEDTGYKFMALYLWWYCIYGTTHYAYNWTLWTASTINRFKCCRPIQFGGFFRWSYSIVPAVGRSLLT